MSSPSVNRPVRRASNPGKGVPSPRPVTRRRRRRPGAATIAWRWALVVGVLLASGAAVRFVPGSPLAASRPNPTSAPASTPVPETTPAPTPTPSPTPPPLMFRAATLTVKAEGFFSWALMDRRTGEIWGSANMAGTTWPASMIKPWLASDFLRRASEKGQTPNAATMSELERVIRDSDNDAAQDIYVRNGSGASIKRLITLCQLTDTRVDGRGWSFTNISAQDTVRMADCIGDGTAAGPRWTAWVLDAMRNVRLGDFGIRKALPAAEAAKVSIKNGWLFYEDDHNWHINCMAVSETWAMAVLQRYPGHGKYTSDFLYGQRVCQDVATQLINPDYPISG